MSPENARLLRLMGLLLALAVVAGLAGAWVVR